MEFIKNQMCYLYQTLTGIVDNVLSSNIYGKCCMIYPSAAMYKLFTA